MTTAACSGSTVVPSATADAPLGAEPTSAPVDGVADTTGAHPASEPSSEAGKTQPPPTATPIAPSDPFAGVERPNIRVESPILDMMDDLAYPEDGVGQLYAIDIDRFFASIDVNRADFCTDQIGYKAAFLEASNGGWEMSTPIFFRPWSDDEIDDLTDVERSFGFRFCDIAAEMHYRLPNSFIHVEIDPAEVVAAAEADERWSDVLTVEQRATHLLLDWGRFSWTDERERSAMFDLISGGTLALVDDTVMRTTGPDRAAAAFDPERPRLSELGTLAATAELLLAEGASSMMLSDQPYSVNPMTVLSPGELVGHDGEMSDQLERAIELSRRGLALWTSLGIGAGLIDGQRSGIVVFAHLDTETAAENAVRFRAIVEHGHNIGDDVPWRDYFTIDELRVEGSFVIVHLGVPDTVHSHFGGVLYPFATQSSLYAVGPDSPGHGG